MTDVQKPEDGKVSAVPEPMAIEESVSERKEFQELGSG
jgi:hypothetical protein